MNELLVPKGLQNTFRLWILRAIVKLNKFDSFLDNCRDDDVFELLGIKGDPDKSKKIELLKSSLIRYESKNIKTPKILQANLDTLTKALKLNYTECKILEFIVLLNNFDLLENATDFLEDMNASSIVIVLSKILNLNANSVKQALLPNSNLLSGQILKSHASYSGYSRLNSYFGFNDSEFALDMISEVCGIDRLFKNVFKKCDKTGLKFDDFNYLGINEANIKEHISKAKNGVNILLYGLPGTGKTEFAKLVAQSLDRGLYEVVYEKSDRYGSVMDGADRLLCLQASNKILNPKFSMLMLDEASDVFSDKNISKALLNRTLEGNSVPTFWLTNDIYGIDNAYIRRFDMVIEFKIPPKSKRFEILQHYTKGQIDEKVLKKLAKNRAIAPALISNATKVVSNLSCENKDEVFKNLINANLKAQGYIKSKKKDKKKKDEISLPKSYKTEFINSSTDLKELTSGIKQNPNARICIYGVAGTGKSAYAKHLAKTLNKPLILKKASDLISMYLGETEKNIARAFKEAKDKKAVLVFDEVDTFLQDRNDAVRSWEISQVNEMLVQMESFDGIFIATTNLVDRLDRASIRRFDMKIEFSYLKPKQALKLFMKECEILGLEVPDSTKERALNFRLLTPGDFAAVLRANKFNPIKTADEFANRLIDEIKYKGIENSGKKIGF